MTQLRKLDRPTRRIAPSSIIYAPTPRKIACRAGCLPATTALPSPHSRPRITTKSTKPHLLPPPLNPSPTLYQRRAANIVGFGLPTRPQIDRRVFPLFFLPVATQLIISNRPACRLEMPESCRKQTTATRSNRHKCSRHFHTCLPTSIPTAQTRTLLNSMSEPAWPRPSTSPWKR